MNENCDKYEPSTRTKYTYDALNRKTQESPTAPNTETHSFFYDQASVYGISTTNPIGRLTMETTTFPSFSILSAATIYWNHDSMGRVSGVKECTETSCNGSNPATSVWYNLNYTYDLAGNRTSYTDGLSTTINESYDGAGRLATVSSTNAGSTVTRWTANSYGPIGLTQATFGNGTVESRSYDNRERLYSIGLKNGAGQTIYSEGLTFDLASNVKTANDLVNGSWTYHYDTLNRLSSAVASTTGPNAGEGCSYGYDPFGNRAQESSFQGTCFSPAPFTFTGNRINGYCYDSAGNLVDLGTCPSGNHQFFYDGYENLLSPNFNSASRNSYAANSQGQRISKYSSGTIVHQYLYGQDQDAVAELDGQGNWLQTNVRAGGLFLLELQSSGATYLHTDHLGTIRLETNPTGTVVETCTNLPFNEALVCNGSSNPVGYHFTGKEHDPESGNDYFGARYYASSMGRFMSPDWSPDPDTVPFAEFENPQTLNLYSYGNNPLTYSDPDGHSVQICDNNGHCQTVDDDVYKAAQQASNSSLNGASLASLQNSSSGAGTLTSTDANGNTTNVGTVQWTPDNPGIQGPAAMAGFNQLANTSRVVQAGAAVYAGVYAGAFACAAYCPAAATAAVGLFHTGLRAGMVIGGYVLTTHAAEQAERFGVTEEEIEEAVEGVAKGNPNPERAWDSVQRFYTATCEVRVNKVTGTIVTVINKITR
jgi:RHS repeat-associated protein